MSSPFFLDMRSFFVIAAVFAAAANADHRITLRVRFFPGTLNPNQLSFISEQLRLRRRVDA
jgi:hypothetical protein